MSSLKADSDGKVYFNNELGDSFKGVLIKFSRHVMISEVYNPRCAIKTGELLTDVQIFFRDNLIYKGKAVVDSLMNTGLMHVVSTTLIDPIEEKERQGVVKEEIRDFLKGWEKANLLNPEFRLIVNDIRSFLLDFNRWLQRYQPGDDEPEKADALYRDLLIPLKQELTKLFLRFEEVIQKVPSDQLDVYKIYAQKNIHPLILGTPFIHRTFDKPLGYAGDYEMVNMMLRDPREGEGLYNQLVNSYFLQIPPTEAHRNRIDMLFKALCREVLRVKHLGDSFKGFNVACGPAVELQRFAATELTESCEFDLLDFNEETINHTKEQISLAGQSNPKPASFNFIKNSVQNLLQEARSHDVNTGSELYDMVYCAGLFDYLSDRTCERLLKLFYHKLKPGGVVLVTNVHPINYSKGTMDFLMEWYLKYRDEEELLALAGSGTDAEVYAEQTGLNIFLEIRKPETDK